MFNRVTPKVTTDSTVEAVSLQDVKDYMRIDTTDDDSVISSMLKAARQIAEKYTATSFVTKTVTLTLDRFKGGMEFEGGTYTLPISEVYGGDGDSVDLPLGPIQSVTSVTTYNDANTSAVFSSGNYYLDSAGERIVLNFGQVWPVDLRDRAAVEVVYVAGYGSLATAVPEPIRLAIMQLTDKMYQSRSALCELPCDCKALLDPYRRTQTAGIIC
jgi:hypothetical protein